MRKRNLGILLDILIITCGILLLLNIPLYVNIFHLIFVFIGIGNVIYGTIHLIGDIKEK